MKRSRSRLLLPVVSAVALVTMIAAPAHAAITVNNDDIDSDGADDNIHRSCSGRQPDRVGGRSAGRRLRHLGVVLTVDAGGGTDTVNLANVIKAAAFPALDYTYRRRRRGGPRGGRPGDRLAPLRPDRGPVRPGYHDRRRGQRPHRSAARPSAGGPGDDTFSTFRGQRARSPGATATTASSQVSSPAAASTAVSATDSLESTTSTRPRSRSPAADLSPSPRAASQLAAAGASRVLLGLGHRGALCHVPQGRRADRGCDDVPRQRGACRGVARASTTSPVVRSTTASMGGTGNDTAHRQRRRRPAGSRRRRRCRERPGRSGRSASTAERGPTPSWPTSADVLSRACCFRPLRSCLRRPVRRRPGRSRARTR